MLWKPSGSRININYDGPPPVIPTPGFHREKEATGDAEIKTTLQPDKDGKRWRVDENDTVYAASGEAIGTWDKSTSTVEPRWSLFGSTRVLFNPSLQCDQCTKEYAPPPPFTKALLRIPFRFEQAKVQGEKRFLKTND